MAGYWPRSFFACLWTEPKSKSINSQKKERGQYPAILTEQTWSIKDLLYGFWWNFACGIQRVVPSGQDGSILPARVANQSARFGSSCPLTERAIYICYLPGGRSVWEKTVPEVLSTARGRRPRAVLKTKGTVFSHTDRPSPVNNIFIFFLQ